MPEWDDLAFPTGPSSIKRQMCCHVWHMLGFLDASFASERERSSYLSLPGATTARPVNCDQADLGLHIQVTPKPDWMLTDLTYDLLRWQMADTWRLLQSDKKCTYEEVLETDTAIRRYLSSVPPEISSAAPDGTLRTSQILWKRGLLLCGTYAQLIRLHRPWFHRVSRVDARHHHTTLARIASDPKIRS